MKILAIESSCDEMSMSVIEDGIKDLGTIICSQIDTHKMYGGVVPEIASRQHVESVTIVLEETLKKANLKIEDIDAFAVTYGPGLIGSLLVGVLAAKTLAFIYKKPLIPVNHISGHIYANNLVKRMEFPLIALVVSGGHTELIYMKEDYNFEKIGGTLDDAVGECYDKVARVLNFPYPGGPYIDRISKEGHDTYNLPLPLNDNTYDFSFSGIKSAVINLAHNEKQKGNSIRECDLACSFQNRVVEIISKKTMKAIKEYNVKHLILAGGVAANSAIRNELELKCKENDIDFTMPDLIYCTDNAAMIGASAYYAYQKGIIADETLNAKSNANLSELMK